MSIETLLEAAKYVDKADIATTEENTSILKQQIMTTTNSNTSDGAIQHWRKRAVAQSVMELSQKSARNTPSLDTNPSGDSMDRCSTSKSTKSPLTSLGKSLVSSFQIMTPAQFPTLQKDTNTADVLTSQTENLISSSNGIISPRLDVAGFPSSKIQGVNGQPTPVSETLNTTQQPVFGKRELRQPVATLTIQNTSIFPHSFANSSTAANHSGILVKSWSDRKNTPTMEMTKKKGHIGTDTREAHNKLEKSRRAHLKECFDKLRTIIPNLNSKVSNLVILRESLKYVHALEQDGLKLMAERDTLMQKNLKKEIRLEKLKQQCSKFKKPAEIEDVLKRATGNDMVSIGEESFDIRKGAAVSSYPSVGENVPTVSDNNTFLSQLIDKAPHTSTPNQVEIPSHIMLPVTTISQQQEKDSSGSVSSHTSVTNSNTSHKIFDPPISSEINLMWHNTNDLRRVRTMLPPPQVQLACTEVPKNTDTQKIDPTSNGKILLTFPPVSSFMHFKPIPVTSQQDPSIKSYRGWNFSAGGIPNFMEGCRNPLKIVVKPVDSAKQQARVVKSDTKRVTKTVSADGAKSSQKAMRPRQTELVFRPRSSITPPPPSRITPYFPRFSVGSGGSPPLTTIMPDMNDMPEDCDNGDIMHMHQGEFTFWRSKFGDSSSSSVEDDEKVTPPSTTKRKHQVRSNCSENAAAKVPKLQACVFSCSNGQNNCNTALVKSSHPHTVDKTKVLDSITKPSNEKVPESGSFVMTDPPFVTQNKSVTEVCYSTLPKPAVLFFPPQLTENNPLKQESQSETKSFSSLPQHLTSKSNLVMTSSLLTLASSLSSQTGGYQFLPSTIMTPKIEPPSQVIMSVTGNNVMGSTSKASSRSPLTSNLTPTAKNTDSQTTFPVPQVQYVFPMGYPGVVAGPNVAFPQAMGGFIPVVPQGHNWGYIMPQNVVVATNNRNETATLPKETVPTIAKSDKSLTCSNSPVVNSTLAKGMEKHLPIVSVAMKLQAQPTSPKEKSQTVTKQVQQQFQTVGTTHQPGEQIMVPVTPGQAGGFVMGGMPAMSSTQGGNFGYQMPMNIIGYPMQIGGTPSFQLAAMPHAAMNFSRVPGISFGFAGGPPTRVIQGLPQSAIMGDVGVTNGDVTTSET